MKRQRRRVPATLSSIRFGAVGWVRAGLNTNQPVWGIRGGLLWAIPPGGFPAPGGPRGLIEGQTFIFGLTRKTPAELGLKAEKN